jgi:predicted anti-sigma-YlaC factor YlaD
MSCSRFPEDLLLQFVLEESTAIDDQRVREHVSRCSLCRQEINTLREVLRCETTAQPDEASTAGLLRVLDRQARRRRPAWSVLRQHPSLVAAAAALVALFFSAGFVQGSLMERRAQERQDVRVVRSRALPAPPELGMLALQTVSSSTNSWSIDRAESVGVAHAVDSL